MFAVLNDLFQSRGRRSGSAKEKNYLFSFRSWKSDDHIVVFHVHVSVCVCAAVVIFHCSTLFGRADSAVHESDDDGGG